MKNIKALKESLKLEEDFGKYYVAYVGETTEYKEKFIKWFEFSFANGLVNENNHNYNKYLRYKKDLETNQNLISFNEARKLRSSVKDLNSIKTILRETYKFN